MEQRGRPPAIRVMRKLNQHWTPEQLAWLQARAQRSGIGTVAGVARMIVQAEIERERQQEASA